jgi:hypothetical protein
VNAEKVALAPGRRATWRREAGLLASVAGATAAVLGAKAESLTFAALVVAALLVGAAQQALP